MRAGRRPQGDSILSEADYLECKDRRYTQKQIIDDPDLWLDGMHQTYEKYGYPDVVIPAPPGVILFGESLPVNKPGYQLPDDDLFQFVETCNIHEEDY